MTAPRSAAVLAAALLMPGAALAPPPDQRPPVTLGLAAVSSPSPYAGVDERPVTVVPFANFEAGRFYLRGLEAGYRLAEGEAFSAAAILQPRFQSYSPGDSPALDGMEARRRTAEGGLRAGVRLGRWKVGLRGVSDLLGRHDGQTVTFDAGVRLGGPRLGVTPSAGLQWQSANFVDYYYGVRASEARPDRPAYTGQAAFNPFLGASVRWRLGGRWGVFALARHAWLDSAITDSPIVDRGTDNSGVLALTYALGSGGPPARAGP